MALPTAPDFQRPYSFPRGFSFRREPFGGILYHYAGIKPDPRVTFVDNPFLLDLLERVDDGPLEELISGVSSHFALSPEDEAAIRSFFATLIERGALVDRDQCEVCGIPDAAVVSSDPAPASVETGSR